jgi:alpha-glucosidase/alpha-D-xyloside xylohydrolase
MAPMSPHISRRDAVKRIGAAGVTALVPTAILRGQSTDIRVAGRAVEIAVTSLSRHTVRLTIAPIEGGRTATVPLNGGLVNVEASRVESRIRRPTRTVRLGDLTVRFTTDPPTIHVDTNRGTRVQKLTLSADAPGMSFQLPEGPLLGLGEGGPQFDRKGSVDRMRNGQGGYQLRTHGGRAPVQWLIGTDGWGMFIHHPQGAFDFSATEGRFTPHQEELPLDVFVVASTDPATLMSEYARITGFPELPPLWSLGYMQSHRTLAGPDEVMWVAETFRQKQLPCDALIYLGTEFTPSGWNTRNGEFTWHSGNFPDPNAAIEKLHAMHYKVVLHIVIEGRLLTGTVDEPCTPDKAVPSGRTADNRWPDDRPVPCYWPYHKPLMDLGVDGWWPDQGDGLEVASRLNRHRMYWEGSQKYRVNERPFALHRNGAAGMQRYGAFLWSGDVYSTWETLRTHVAVAVNTGLSGIPYWGSDIGGFVPTAEYTGELHVRWFQFGAFCPSFRSHGRTWHLRLPWGWNTGQLGPSEITNYRGGAANPDPSELRNPHVEPIVKKYLELRYRLLPYTYSIAREGTKTGLPMMRALWLHHPDDAAAAVRGDQFLWGRDLLVSPVVEKGATMRRLYMPKGTWFDFWTDERVDGGREISRQVDLGTMPLHVRAGAILPLGPITQYVEQRVETPLTLTIYPGADGAFMLYEDDGRSFEYRKGAWMGIDVGWRDAERRLTLALARGSRVLAPGRRPIDVRIAGEKDVRRVSFEGKPLSIGLP